MSSSSPPPAAWSESLARVSRPWLLRLNALPRAVLLLGTIAVLGLGVFVPGVGGAFFLLRHRRCSCSGWPCSPGRRSTQARGCSASAWPCSSSGSPSPRPSASSEPVLTIVVHLDEDEAHALTSHAHPSSLAVVGLLALTACSGTVATARRAAPAGSSGSVPAGTITVVTSFYPLEYLVERVGGSAVEVTNLAARGRSRTTSSSTPKDVAAIAEADQVVYLSGLPARGRRRGRRPRPRHLVGRRRGGRPLPDLHADRGGPTATDEAGSTDPHFWLDPTRYAQVAEALADELSALSPADAEDFAANAAAVTAELTALDAEWAAATGPARAGTSSRATTPSATSPSGTTSSSGASRGSPRRTSRRRRPSRPRRTSSGRTTWRPSTTRPW